ncbi:MAG: Hsp20/alpha crystallin family protein [Alphaproteobacteria bacterium]|nr:Hsp20/alpha crystallin family protein [Alphaproteobacteria bacterium]MBV8548861.1 Hsp20/alpha crystallin family protein [Alphaproteobacteria bacterium]
MVLRSLITGSPLRYSEDPFNTLQRAMQRSFEDAWRGLPSTQLEAAALPVRLDVREDEKAFHVTTDLPGLTEKDIDVTFDDGLLTIRGEKKISRDEKKDTWHVVERAHGSFARQLSLAAAVDANKVEASFDKGVLTITLPKQPVEQTAAKKIAIKSA